MANWEIVKEAEEGSGIYQLVYKLSQQHQGEGMVALGSTQWPKPAPYAYRINGEYIAAPDDCVAVWRAQKDVAAFAVMAAKALPLVKQLRGLLAAFGMSIPTTEAAATEAIAQMELTGDQVAALGALGVTWQAVQSAGIADHLEAILATEAAQ